MKIGKAVLIPVLALLFLAPSCRQQPEDMIYADVTYNSWWPMFDAYWKNMNRNYIMFEYDYPGNGWDKVYDEYSPLFNKLGTVGADENESKTAARYFFDIIKNLSDNHYSLEIKLSPDFTWVMAPGEYRKMKDAIITSPADRAGEHLTDDEIFEYFWTRNLDGIDLFMAGESWRAVMRNTFGISNLDATAEVSTSTLLGNRKFEGGYVYSGTSAAGWSVRILYGLIDDRILYFSFDAFDFNNFISSDGDNAIKELIKNYEALLNDEAVEAIIFDIRGNAGGYNSDLDLIWGPLIDTDMPYDRIRIKDGANRTDFSPWKTEYLKASGKSNIDKPITLLFNRNTMSCGDLSVLIFQCMREQFGMNIETFGSGNSAGGTCTLHVGSFYNGSDEILLPAWNAGSFTILPGMMTVYAPDTLRTGLDGTFYEGIGVAPDNLIELTPEYKDALLAGNDPTLTAALEWIEKQ